MLNSRHLGIRSGVRLGVRSGTGLGAGLAATTLLTVSLGLPVFSITSLALSTSVSAQTNPVSLRNSFSDLQPSYWASTYIDELANRGIISGFSDGSFRPTALVSRAQFAAMLEKSLRLSASRGVQRPRVSFRDVPSNYWASRAIEMAYTSSFLNAYGDGSFRPEAALSRQEVLAGLATGLGYGVQRNVETTLALYSDQGAIAPNIRTSLAAATERNLVVNYPTVTQLNPNGLLTRAEAAALLYQALTNEGQVRAVSSPYLVAAIPTGTPVAQAATLPAGTVIPLRYDKAERILVTKEERMAVTLTTTQPLTSAQGTVVLPAGCQVVGELQPVDGGSQFVGTEVIFPDGRRAPIRVISNVVRETETIQKGVNTGSVLKGAAIGAGVATVISGTVGNRNISWWKVLAGAGGGAVAGTLLGRNKVEVISVKPTQNLTVTLQSSF